MSKLKISDSNADKHLSKVKTKFSSNSFARSCIARPAKHRRWDNLLPGNCRGKGALKKLTPR